jgi:serine/threonine-protein kinase
MGTCPTCGTRYSDSQHLCPRDGGVLEPDRQPELDAVGQVLDGKYRLDAYLSRGGMGAVYRAMHLMLGTPVAVKLINPTLVTSSEMVRRFQREARAAAQLQHPHIVRVYDMGETQDGTLYIAMDLLTGESLSQTIRSQGALSTPRIVAILRQVLSALASAHRAGIVHRDLKPHNIMIGRAADGGDFATLLEFGIAKSFDLETQTRLTATGSAIGTPHYMSPEQAGGLPVDARSDLYSVGVIVYEMLTGDVPFDDTSAPAIMVKHLTEPPVPPSQRNPGTRVDPQLEAIAMRCLEKKPDARFQSAEEILAQLARLDDAATDGGGATLRVRESAIERALQTPTAGVTQPAVPGSNRMPSALFASGASTVVLPPETDTVPPAAALSKHDPQAVSVAKVIDVQRRSRTIPYAAAGLAIAATVGGAALVMQQPRSERPVRASTPSDTRALPAGGSGAITPPVPQPGGGGPPKEADPVTTAGNTPTQNDAAGAEVKQSTTAAPKAPVTPSSISAGTPLSNALAARVRAMLLEQKIDGSKLRRVQLEMTTRPSPLGRGITADYVATIRLAAGERTFTGNHLGFAELTLRNEVVDKAAAQIVEFLAAQ